MILIAALNPALDVTHHVPGADWAGVNLSTAAGADKEIAGPAAACATIAGSAAVPVAVHLDDATGHGS